MKVQTTLIVVATLACVAFTGCTDVKSVEYYTAHPDEAVKKLEKCRKEGKSQNSESACANPARGYGLFLVAQDKAATEAFITELQKMRKEASK
ncbi:EexN family lipoprotein [Polaromonas sp. JS666]|uniref:EexN family lipoprotein n=1 Tax=Polaromonas sp. (strain JS666 / ATCC BAA-500) TaxID=296591 RepID=UPI000053253B|nr:EexN family lipoprotein [Polaromonas sp. JS666]ABE47314.1 hypothetical protein Bpro_5460 [Polaromonas sp. JS666]